MGAIESGHLRTWNEKAVQIDLCSVDQSALESGSKTQCIHQHSEYPLSLTIMIGMRDLSDGAYPVVQNVKKWHQGMLVHTEHCRLSTLFLRTKWYLSSALSTHPASRHFLQIFVHLFARSWNCWTRSFLAVSGLLQVFLWQGNSLMLQNETWSFQTNPNDVILRIPSNQSCVMTSKFCSSLTSKQMAELLHQLPSHEPRHEVFSSKRRSHASFTMRHTTQI